MNNLFLVLAGGNWNGNGWVVIVVVVFQLRLFI